MPPPAAQPLPRAPPQPLHVSNAGGEPETPEQLRERERQAALASGFTPGTRACARARVCVSSFRHSVVLRADANACFLCGSRSAGAAARAARRVRHAARRVRRPGGSERSDGDGDGAERMHAACGRRRRCSAKRASAAQAAHAAASSSSTARSCAPLSGGAAEPGGGGAFVTHPASRAAPRWRGRGVAPADIRGAACMPLGGAGVRAVSRPPLAAVVCSERAGTRTRTDVDVGAHARAKAAPLPRRDRRRMRCTSTCSATHHARMQTTRCCLVLRRLHMSHAPRPSAPRLARVRTHTHTRARARAHAMKTPWLRAPHEAPPGLVTPRCRLRALLMSDAVGDYDAVMSSREALWECFGPGSDWPREDLSLEQDTIDLAWHQAREKGAHTRGCGVAVTPRVCVCMCVCVCVRRCARGAERVSAAPELRVHGGGAGGRPHPGLRVRARTHHTHAHTHQRTTAWP
jgi:hypothetical protein